MPGVAVALAARSGGVIVAGQILDAMRKQGALPHQRSHDEPSETLRKR